MVELIAPLNLQALTVTELLFNQCWRFQVKSISVLIEKKLLFIKLAHMQDEMTDSGMILIWTTIYRRNPLSHDVLL